MLPSILEIWESNTKRGRYQSKWKESKWVATIEDMAHEEEFLTELLHRLDYHESDFTSGAYAFESVQMQ